MRSTVWVASVVYLPYDGRPKWCYMTTFETYTEASGWLRDDRYPARKGRRISCKKRIDRFDRIMP